ncbi:MAG: glycoside hydrolase family 13 protein [Clostridia bacterium]|jgi:glycosidase|nr:glycoside hydrolase family 13 protein [Clostridia bacterium]
MNRHAAHHKTKSNYAFAYDNEKMYIRLRLDKHDDVKVYLEYTDRYHLSDFDFDTSKLNDLHKVLMEVEAEDELFKYYVAEVNPEDCNNRVGYIFKIIEDEETYYYGSRGLNHISEISLEEMRKEIFNFPYVNNVDIHRVPKWVKNATFYQIFVERFSNGDPSINPDNIVSWDAEPKWDNFFGGDIRGIINNLSHIEDLGITALYLTPVFKATTNHKYDTVDYMEIDPHFGTKEDFKELVDKCHARGIKVMLDAVFNHSSYMFDKFQDIMKNGENSKYVDWYHIKEFPVDINKVNYETFEYVHNLPKLNTENKEVKEYLLNVAKYWTEEFKIDGWRLDVANEVDHVFWREFRELVKSINEDIYICGEIWHNAFEWNRGDQFDSTMNYPLSNAMVDYFAHNKMSTDEFIKLTSRLKINNTKQVNEIMFNLLGSHDTPRILTTCKGDKFKLMAAATFQLLYTGTPCIYYGTEIGMLGEGDPDCRRGMIWDQSDWEKDIYNFYKKIISIRNNILVNAKEEYILINDEEVLVMKNDVLSISIDNKQKEIIINDEIIISMKEALSI